MLLYHFIVCFMCGYTLIINEWMNEWMNKLLVRGTSLNADMNDEVHGNGDAACYSWQSRSDERFDVSTDAEWHPVNGHAALIVPGRLRRLRSQANETGVAASRRQIESQEDQSKPERLLAPRHICLYRECICTSSLYYQYLSFIGQITVCEFLGQLTRRSPSPF